MPDRPLAALGQARPRLKRRRALGLYFVLLVAVFGATAIAATVYVTKQTEHDARKSAHVHAAAAADAAAREVGEFLAAIRGPVVQLAQSPGTVKALTHPDGCSLTVAGIGGPDDTHLDILRRDGTVACSSRGPKSRANYADAAWFKRALAGATGVTIAKDGATGAQAAITGAPLPGRKGVVAGFADLTPVGPHLSRTIAGRAPIEFMVTTTGADRVVVARSIDPQRWVGRSAGGTAFARAGDRIERRDVDGKARIYSDAKVAGVPWRVSAGEDEQQVLADTDQLQRRQRWIILGCLAAFVLLAALVYRSLAIPIKRLSATLRAAKSNALPDRVPVSGPAEVAALGEDVNGLIALVNRELRDRRRAEEQAQGSEATYRLLFDRNPSPMWVFDLETRAFLAVNHAATQTYGYSRGEFHSMTIDDIRPPEEMDRLTDALRVAGTTMSAAGIWRHRRKDGSELLVEVTTNVIEFRGRAARLVLALDVTDRVHAEQALRDSEARHRDFIEHANDMISTADPEGRLLTVNAAFERVLGYTREELTGKRLADLVAPEQLDHLDSVLELHKHADVAPYERVLVAKDGRRVVVEVSSRAIERDGRRLIQAICRDVTDRRELEAQLRQAQRLESVGRLAGGIAHDFNNFLTVIAGYTEMLMADGNGSAAPELEQIDGAAKRAAALTRQLLAFSRRQVLKPTLVNLNDIVEGVAPMLGRLIGEDIAFATRLDPEIDPVMADPSQLEQVIVNLVVNARDAMSDGGALTIETGTVFLDEDYVAHHGGSTVGPHVMLAVSDTGAGMTPETLGKVFEPFFTTKGVASGTGLGLATVYGVVKQSGGNIWAYSEPGKGSTFKVYFPAVQDQHAAPADEEAPPSAAGGTETILLAEDEPPVRELTARILGSHGYTVLVATTSDEALRLVREHGDDIDLLLTDVVMPSTNGPELAKLALEHAPSLRVLFMSGYTDEAMSHHGILNAGSALVEKPFSSVQLARAVRDALDAVS